MPVVLAQNEKVIRSYDYATFKTLNVAKTSNAARNLTITNKRVIHTESTGGTGTSCINVSEMPVKSAKFVNVYYGQRSLSVFLIWAVIFAIVGVLGFAVIKLTALGLVGLALTVVFALLYKFKKDYALNCNIKADTFIIPAMGFEVKAGNSIFKKFFNRFRKAEKATFINVRVRINKEVAKVMAEELGAVIIEAANE